MLLVSNLPGYLGRGGPYLHDLRVDGAAGSQRLLLGLVLLQKGERIEETPPRAPEVLAEGLQSVQLRYRGIDAATIQLTAWLPRWDDTRRLPLLVEVRVVPAQGAAWPPLVVALNAGGSAQPGPGNEPAHTRHRAGAGAAADCAADRAGRRIRTERARGAPAAGRAGQRCTRPGARPRRPGICAVAAAPGPTAPGLAGRWQQLPLAVRWHPHRHRRDR
ncbi:MAG: hypothetical protein GAK31_03066 [Stenotrophomonas maltophilia]|uniref:Uncharacterized protein n=1 Tax=Stenotrophomonas maltophilia TaxID=40324 RepID=A0A7V8FEU8_STEMA|nr:MAG: hypothetical protein GAK31_03066 [Stenotrophomonas maltophilia]